VRVLLDECVDRRLAPELHGHEIRTVPQMGWSGAENGRLLNLAAGRFDVFITMDRALPSQQHAPRPGLSLLLLRARSNRVTDLKPLVPELLRVLSTASPAEVYVVGDAT